MLLLAAAHLTLMLPLSVNLEHCGLGTVKYEDFDQLVAEFVEPLVANYNAVSSYRCAMTLYQAGRQAGSKWGICVCV